MTNDERIERLEAELKLERKRRRWGQGATLLACLLSFGLFEGAQRLTAGNDFEGEIRATGFTLVNENGETRAALGFFLGEPHLDIYDRNGESRASLSVIDAHGASLSMSDSNGYLRASLSVSDNYGPLLSMIDANGVPSAALGSSDEGAVLMMIDSNNILRAGLRVNDDAPLLEMFDSNGRSTWQAP